jgi:hypothetical protein
LFEPYQGKFDFTFLFYLDLAPASQLIANEGFERPALSFENRKDAIGHTGEKLGSPFGHCSKDIEKAVDHPSRHLLLS